ncbi:S8 family serine peptidase, partial [Patescibacteria group bacterium]|nr:S8 family serine peptidase [Patescibacteria group bacterium]
MKISLHALLGFLVFVGLLSSMQANAQSVTESGFQLNDTFYNRQWYMNFIHAPQAWDVATSSERQVVVALIDGGIDDSHPDLKGILWEDPDEPIDGKDNDGDGYVDDVHGWNFVLESEDIRPIARKYGNEAWEHGTIVASLIGARGNDDIGIAGLAWNVKIMPLVILDSDGLGGTDNLVKAIDYAMLHRVDIINMSLEGNSMDENVADAIK